MRRSIVWGLMNGQQPVFRIRIGPDPDFYFSADPDPGIRIQGANQCGSTWILVKLCRRKKLDFDMKNIFNVGNMS